jgi:hypothetical protein
MAPLGFSMRDLMASEARDRGSESARSRRSASRRLWPLLFLPLIGAVVGIFVCPYLDQFHSMAVGARGTTDPLMNAAYGLFVGNALMIVVAILVGGYRAARKRFTIRTILIVVALCAICLTLARAILFWIIRMPRPCLRPDPLESFHVGEPPIVGSQG